MTVDTYRLSRAYVVAEEHVEEPLEEPATEPFVDGSPSPTDSGSEPVVVGDPEPGVELCETEVNDAMSQRLDELHGGVLLSPTGIAYLAQCLKPRSYRAGELIIREGVRGDFLAVVTKGGVAVHESSADRPLRALEGELPQVLLLPGSTFGEAMLSDGRPCGSTLRAVVDTELCILQRSDYLTVAWRRGSRASGESDVRRRWLQLAAVAVLAVVAAAVLFVGLRAVLGSKAEPELSPAAAALQEEGLGPAPSGGEGSLLERWSQAGRVGRYPMVSTTGEAPDSAAESVRILAPELDQVQKQSASIPVRALLSAPGVLQAQLEVDGQGLGILVNPDPDKSPWLAEWEWDGPNDGPHVLTVNAHSTDGEVVLSSPVTVTVVPACQLIFSSNRDGSNAIYSMETDGSSPTRLTSGVGEARQPAWGPGDSLTFVSETEDGQAVIRRMELDSDEATEVFLGRDPAWSPTESRLAYTSGSDHVSQVFTAKSNAVYPYQLTRELVYAGQPAWSPDGMRLAYVAERDGNWDIWVVGKDGGNARRLTDNPAKDWAPAWSPDGSKLAFVSDRSGSHQIHVMRADGTQVKRLTKYDRGAEAPAWSPDGFWLAHVAYTGDGTGIDGREIHMMRADGSARVRLTNNEFDDNQPAWCQGP